MPDLISSHKFYFILPVNLKNNALYAHPLCTAQTAANIHCSQQCGLRVWPLSVRIPHYCRYFFYDKNQILHYMAEGSGCKKGGSIHSHGRVLSAAVVCIGCECAWKDFIECSFTGIVSLHSLIGGIKISVLDKKGIIILANNSVMLLE